MSGTMIAQAVPVLVSPVLTRLYSPAELGNLALFVSIINVAGTVIAGRYEMAILFAQVAPGGSIYFQYRRLACGHGEPGFIFSFAVSGGFSSYGATWLQYAFCVIACFDFPVRVF